MPGDFTYNRKFIILKDDYTTIDSINPKGHGKIEIRGNKGILRLNVENCESEQYYHVYFLKEKNGEVDELELGRIITDERGKGTADINFSLKEMELQGFPIDKIEAIVIKQGTDIVLSGHINKSSGIMEKYVKTISTEKTEIEQVQEPILQEERALEDEDSKPQEDLSKHFPFGFIGGVPDVEKPEEVVEEKVEENIQEHIPEEIPVQEEIKEELEEKAQEELKQEEIKTEEKVEHNMETPQENFRETANYQFQGTYQPEYTYDQIEYMRRLNHKNQMTDYILSILKYFPKVEPFKVYLHGYTWWRIDDDGYNSYRGFLPYYNYLLSADYKYPFLYNSATCIDQIRKYGHYLFGIYSENNQAKYYMYAIPGRFVTEEHPFKGITGFNTWYDSIDGVGYWILYIDPLTGKVIYPINPMVPAE